MPRTPEIAEVSASFVKEYLTRYLLHESEYSTLRKELLANRENTEPNSIREWALDNLWNIAARAVTYGTGALSLAADFAPFRIPSISSLTLIRLGVIKDPETIKQVELRKKERNKRGKGPPENWVVARRATAGEARQLGLEKTKVPIIVLTEHYTVAIPKYPTIELDRVGTFAMYHGESGLTLLFLGETQEPHGHAQIGDRWYRIDRESHPDFSLPSDLSLPEPKQPSEPVLPTNVQIATLLVLFNEGIRTSKSDLP